jgi:hypothetical protein
MTSSTRATEIWPLAQAVSINLRRAGFPWTVSSSAQMCSKSPLEARSIIVISFRQRNEIREG